MNKNQAVLWMIVAVLVVVAIFLYFVFRGGDQTATEEQMQEINGEYTADIGEDVLRQIASETAEEANGNQKSTSVEEEKIIEQPQMVPASDKVHSNVIASPQTGPSAVVAMIAGMVAVIVSIGVFFKMHKYTAVN